MIVRFHNNQRKIFDFTPLEFIAVTSMLDKNEVYYNPDKKAFYTKTNARIYEEEEIDAEELIADV